MTIGERIAQLRTKKHMTQGELARAIKIGKGVISHIETGVSPPGIETLRAMSRYFEVSVDYLIGNTDQERWCRVLEREYCRNRTVADVLQQMVKLSDDSKNLLVMYMDILIQNQDVKPPHPVEK